MRPHRLHPRRLVELFRPLASSQTGAGVTPPTAAVGRREQEWGPSRRPDDQLTAEAEALATRLAAGPPQALAAAKRLLHTSLEETLESHLAREAEAIAHASGTGEGAEGIASFVEKRAPVFNRD